MEMSNNYAKLFFVAFVAFLLVFSVVAFPLSASLPYSSQKNLGSVSDQSIEPKVKLDIPAELIGYEWPLHGGNPERSCFQEGPGPSSNHILWKKRYYAILHAPIVVNGLVISNAALTSKFDVSGLGMQYEGFLFALDAITGEERWRTPHNDALYSGWSEGGELFKIDDKRFGYHTAGGNFVIYDIETGELLMRFKAGNYLGFGGTYILELKRWIGVGSYTMNQEQTVEAWDFSDPSGPPQLLWRSQPMELIDTRCYYENGRWHVGSNDFYEYCLDANTGEILWVTPMEGPTSFYGTYLDGKIFRASLISQFWALDAATGEILWEYRPEYAGSFSGNTAAAYGKVYHMNADGHLYCWDAETGEVVWRYMLDLIAWGQAKMWYPQAPAIADGKIYCLVADRQKRYPVVGTNHTMFVCLDAETGEDIWRMKDEAEMTHPAIAYGNLYGVDFIYDRDLFTEDWKLENESSVGCYIYCFGKGPTTLDVWTDTYDEYNLEYVVEGGETTIIGNLTDHSPSQPPYLTQQVPIKLTWQLPDGTEGAIATAKTDWWGKLFYKWTPPGPGEYTIIAESEGNDAYEAPETVTTPMKVVKYYPAFPTVEAALAVVVVAVNALLVIMYIRRRKMR